MSDRARPRPTRLPASPFISPARPLSALAGEQLSAIFGKRGFANADMLANWRAIAGEHLARHSQPEKLVWPRRQQVLDEEGPAEGAILHLRVDGPIAIEVQHSAPQIIERINQFFGFSAVARLRILQAPVRRDEDDRPAQAGRGEPDSPAPVKGLEDIADPALARALARLGGAVRRR